MLINVDSENILKFCKFFVRIFDHFAFIIISYYYLSIQYIIIIVIIIIIIIITIIIIISVVVVVVVGGGGDGGTSLTTHKYTLMSIAFLKSALENSSACTGYHYYRLDRVIR